MKSQATYDNEAEHDEFLQSIAPGIWDDDGGIHTAVNEVNAILDSHDDDEEHLLNVYTVGEQEAAMMRESEHERKDRVDQEGREKVDLVIKLLERSGGLKRFSRTFLSISVYDFYFTENHCRSHE